MKRYLLAAGLAVAATPALAHHPLGDVQMETFVHGVLSGIGHPILGFDHLFFIAIVGVVALYTGRRFAAPAAYVAAMLAGCLAMSVGIDLPAKEFVIALSLLVVGGVALTGRALAFTPALLLFAGFGLFHGSAFGDAIAAQEAGAGTAVLVGYLIGLGVVQYAIAIGAGWLAQKLWQAKDASAIQPRLAGAVVAGIGLFLALEEVEGFVFDMLGWAA